MKRGNFTQQEGDKKMKTKLMSVLVITTILAGLVFALPTNKGINKAKEKSPAIDENGNIVAPPPFVTPFPQEPPESELTKVVFIRYAPGKEPLAICGNEVCESKENWKNCPSDCPKGGGEPEPTACYGFLSGARPKWNWVENYYYSDSAGNLGDSSASAVSRWESVTTGDIFGDGIKESNPWGIYDYKNSILYGDYSDPDVLGVTAIWYRGKNIYEYDIMLDTNFFPNGKYDLNTVVLHEFGHAAGLDDLYDVVCVDEVMYGYLGEKEIKTTLGDGDKTGITTLYG